MPDPGKPEPTESDPAKPGTEPVTFDPITEPILNTPYEVTKHHWQLNEENRAMPIRVRGRRPSVAILPVPEEHDPDREQTALDLSKNLNEKVNQIRIEVGKWRESGRYDGATDASKRLLKHWKREDRSPRLFFAQIEALETIIWLSEVAPKVASGATGASKTDSDTAEALLDLVGKESQDNNEGLERLAVKMATGTGKTVVMGMVIVWHAVNAAEAHKLPEDQRGRYLTSFVAITPGHTVRERLETLKPSPQAGVKSVYDEMGLLPRQDRTVLNRVQVHIVNFQSFQSKDRLAAATGDAKRLLRGRNQDKSKSDTEEPSAMLRRVLRGLRGLSDTDPQRQICVLNDEAHHCYLPTEGRRADKESKDDKDADKSAALWFSAIKSLDDSGWLGAVYDFSATPMFIQTSDRRDAKMFPWVVSDYPLMDAIEAGLVKIPRVPVYDDTQLADIEIADTGKAKSTKKSTKKSTGAAGQADLTDLTEIKVKWRNLYRYVDQKRLDQQAMPPKLASAVKTFYENYRTKFVTWEEQGIRVPPVFIVVANNINNAEALYHYVSGTRTPLKDGSGGYETEQSAFDLFSNFAADNELASNLNTLLVHSDLEGDKIIGDKTKLGKAFSVQAELLNKRVDQLSQAGKDVSEYEDLSAKDLVRKALNTVGREGELGANIRCVVSVSMLTEGWDTRTVTHVLGYRAFGTQLLCEQVTGRALRRTSYENFTEEGRLEPQFADVLGIPFDFMPVGGKQPLDPATPDKYEVSSVPGRQSLRIEFPRLTGYLIEPSGIGIVFDPDKVKPYQLESAGPGATDIVGVVGSKQTLSPTTDESSRRQQVVVKVAAGLVEQFLQSFVSEGAGEDHAQRLPRRRQLISNAKTAVEQWLSHPAVGISSEQLWMLGDDEEAHQAAEQVFKTCVPDLANDSPAKRIGTFGGVGEIVGSTEDVNFDTTVPTHYPDNRDEQTKKSELNVAPCDSGWEQSVAGLLDEHPEVQAWARNTPQLDWSLPYQFEGDWRSYIPDFVARIGGEHGDQSAVHLLIEVKGLRDGSDDAKAEYASRWWVPAVRNSPQVPAHLRNWAFVELKSKDSASELAVQLETTIKRVLDASKKLAARKKAPASNKAHKK